MHGQATGTAIELVPSGWYANTGIIHQTPYSSGILALACPRNNGDKSASQRYLAAEPPINKFYFIPINYTFLKFSEVLVLSDVTDFVIDLIVARI